jgi:hypothetical protein
MATSGGTRREWSLWIACSPRSPCRCCGGTAGCSATAVGDFVRCRVVVSPWPVEGGGWLHVAERSGSEARTSPGS